MNYQNNIALFIMFKINFVCSEVISNNDLNQLMFIIRNARLFVLNDNT